MKIIKPFLIFFFLVISWMIWQVYSYFNPNFEECFEENNEYFQEHIFEFNNIVKQIKKLKLSTHKEIVFDKLPESLKIKLEDFGIDSFSISKAENCLEKHRMEFYVAKGWNIKTLKHVSIIYSPCDEDTKLNYHYYNHHIDIWGQDKNWKIFSDTDFFYSFSP